MPRLPCLLTALLALAWAPTLAASFATLPTAAGASSKMAAATGRRRAAVVSPLFSSSASASQAAPAATGGFLPSVALLTRTKGGASAAAGGNKKSLLQSYLDALDTRPLFTKSWSAGLICAFGDVLSQYVVRKAGVPFVIDRKRLAIFSTVGALYIGPAVHYWFGFIDALSKKPAVAKRLPKFKLAPVLFQLSLDQTFGASVLNSGFLICLWVVQALVAGTLFPLGGESGTVNVIASKITREFWPMLMANYKIWPLANLINFSVIPLKCRVLFANVVSVFWNMYLSSASNR